MPNKKSPKKKSFRPHIVHRRHSFKVLPRHHTSYSLLVFIVLLTAIFSIGWTAFVSGASNDSFDYVVRATVPAGPLTEPATIEAPADGRRFTKQLITAEGACPDDSYVTITRNDVYAGAALCTNNRWSIELSLVAGVNILQPQAYNRTDTAGPSTVSRTVYYDAPVATEDLTVVPAAGQTPTPSPSRQSPAVTPLVLSGQFRFLGVLAGNQLNQTFTISGGRAPYAVSIDWGDGTSDVISRPTSGEFTVSHTYAELQDKQQNSYVITLTAGDVAQQKAALQTVVIVSNKATSGNIFLGGVTDDGGTPGVSAFSTFWRVAGPIYAVTLVALGSFWLGERHELELLRRTTVHRRPHKHA